MFLPLKAELGYNSRTMQSNLVPVKVADPPEELSPEYFAKNPGTYSSEIFQALETNQIFNYLFHGPKKPTPTQMLIVSAVVVSAADQRIATLETEKRHLQKEASTIRAVLASPIWSVSSTPYVATTDDESKTIATAGDSTLKAEQQWIARYLTLGNVLGVSLSVILVLGGIVTYFTTNFKDRAHHYEGAATFWEAQSSKFEIAARTAQKERDDAIAAAKIQHDADDANLKASNERLSQSQTLSSNLSKQVEDANKKIADLQKAAASPPASATPTQ